MATTGDEKSNFHLLLLIKAIQKNSVNSLKLHARVAKSRFSNMEKLSWRESFV